jgi:hypothetical protein
MDREYQNLLLIYEKLIKEKSRKKAATKLLKQLEELDINSVAV